MKKSALKTKKPLQAKTALIAKKPISKTAKKHTIGWWKNEAQKIFNKSIKYRDSEYISGEWIFECITCPRRVLFKDREDHTYKGAHAGHFYPEIYSATRFDDENVNGQCFLCNGPGLGEQVRYSRAIDLKYGNGTAKRLEAAAKQKKQWTIPELQEIIREAKEQIAFYESNSSGSHIKQG